MLYVELQMMQSPLPVGARLAWITLSHYHIAVGTTPDTGCLEAESRQESKWLQDDRSQHSGHCVRDSHVAMSVTI